MSKNDESILVEIKNVSKIFKSISGGDVLAIDNISISVKKDEILSIIGPSGSGKSTILNLLAGLEKPTSGTIKYSQGGVENLDIVSSQSPKSTKIGFVFQLNTIFPWRTVETNLVYPLELKKVSKSKRKEKALELCKLIGLNPEVFLKKYPKELSGGEQRRVAIGMALAREANLLLLDEPTSQLDYLTKWSIQNTIQSLWMAKKFTTVLVTHDIEEAIFLGDRVIMLNAGKLRLEKPIEIELSRPRKNDMRSSKEFNLYRSQISQIQKSDEEK